MAAAARRVLTGRLDGIGADSPHHRCEYRGAVRSPMKAHRLLILIKQHVSGQQVWPLGYRQNWRKSLRYLRKCHYAKYASLYVASYLIICAATYEVRVAEAGRTR